MPKFKQPAKPTTTQNADGSTTASFKLSEMSLGQLEQVNQALMHKREELREQQLHIRKLIDAKLEEKRVDEINDQIAALQAQRDGTGAAAPVNGVAPGAVIEAKAEHLKT